MKPMSRWILSAFGVALVGLWLDAAVAADAVSAGYAAPIAKGKSAASCAACGCVCDHHGCGGYCGSCGGCGHGVLGCAVGSLQSAMYSGQPLIDKWARADWIAQQQAAMRSWHAGYYHTQWGVPLALMVPPHARTYTRWSWGVAQTTVQPIYHQYKRPYPGPFGSDGATVGYSPLLPTPRWPSHTDQFGVYHVRGPW